MKVLKKSQEVDLEVLKGQVAGLKAPRGQNVDPQGQAVDLKVLQGQAVGPQGRAVDLRVPRGRAVGLKSPEDQEGVEGVWTYLLSAK